MSLNGLMPPLNRKQWLAIAAINIVISAITTLLVVQALTITPRFPGSTAVANAATVPLRTAQPIVPQVLPTLVLPSSATSLAADKPVAPALVTVLPAAPPPAANDFRIKISNISSLGQFQREQVVISNEGDNIDIKDWKITSPRGISYKFKNVVIFKESFINLYSTAGADTSIDLYMGRTDAAWKIGDILTLETSDGRKVATFEVK